MSRLLVIGRCLGRAISFDQNETRRIITLLRDVKAGDSCFADTCLGVDERGGFEGLNALGLNVNLNVNDQHDEGS